MHRCCIRSKPVTAHSKSALCLSRDSPICTWVRPKVWLIVAAGLVSQADTDAAGAMRIGIDARRRRAYFLVAVDGLCAVHGVLWRLRYRKERRQRVQTVAAYSGQERTQFLL